MNTAPCWKKLTPTRNSLSNSLLSKKYTFSKTKSNFSHSNLPNSTPCINRPKPNSSKTSLWSLRTLSKTLRRKSKTLNDKWNLFPPWFNKIINSKNRTLFWWKKKKNSNGKPTPISKYSLRKKNNWPINKKLSNSHSNHSNKSTKHLNKKFLKSKISKNPIRKIIPILLNK